VTGPGEAPGPGGSAPAAGPPGEGARRPPTLLLASVALSAVSLASLLRPPGLGPVAPFVAGVLAFLGDRAARRARGEQGRSLLARVAMTLALALFVHQSWQVVRHEPLARARAAVAGRVEDAATALRTGTPESAWLLLAGDARAPEARDAFLAGLRRAAAEVGPLLLLGAPAPGGSGWGEATAPFLEGDAARKVLVLEWPEARCARGAARITMEIEARREGRRVWAELRRLEVEPLPPPSGDPPR
jgi:hypothetical protein